MRHNSSQSNQHRSEEFKKYIINHGLYSLFYLKPNILLIVWTQKKYTYIK